MPMMMPYPNPWVRTWMPSEPDAMIEATGFSRAVQAVGCWTRIKDVYVEYLRYEGWVTPIPRYSYDLF